jgi:NitT/TauT family transport system permease protein
MERSIDPADATGTDELVTPPSVAVVAAKPAGQRRGDAAGKSDFTPATFAASIAVLVIFLAAWEWGPRLLGIPEFVLPPASKVWAEFLRMLANDRLLWHTGITALEIIVGFVLGSLLGIVIGFVLGLSPKAEMVLSPYILALQIAPKVAFAPLFVMWLGFTVYPKILVAVLIVFFPVMVNVLTAVRTVDPDMVSLVRALSATRLQIFRLIEIPASLPPLFAGLRIAATLAVIGVVVGELVGGNLGIGYLLTYGEGEGNTAMVFVTIILLTLIGIVAYAAVALCERRVLHYMPRAQHTIT